MNIKGNVARLPLESHLVASTPLHVNHDATPLPHSIYSQPMRSQSPPNSWREPASCTHYRTHTQRHMHTHAELHIHGLIGVKVTSLSCILPFKMLTLKVAAGYNFKQFGVCKYCTVYSRPSLKNYMSCQIKTIQNFMVTSFSCQDEKEHLSDFMLMIVCAVMGLSLHHRHSFPTLKPDRSDKYGLGCLCFKKLLVWNRKVHSMVFYKVSIHPRGYCNLAFD